MLGGADNPNGELPSYITGADRKQCRHIFSGRQQATFPVLMAPVEEQVIVDSVFPGDLRHTGSGLQ